jgi:hypothetical protein
MFIRNVADYADPALGELAWIDPHNRSFWVQHAQDAMPTSPTSLRRGATTATPSRCRSARGVTPIREVRDPQAMTLTFTLCERTDAVIERWERW